MNLKPIEAQLSLHRTTEVGQIQNQLNQKPTQDQSFALNTAEKKQEEMRKAAQKTDEADEAQIREEDRPGSKQGRESKDQSHNQSEGREPQAKHPYKGKHIDFKL